MYTIEENQIINLADSYTLIYPFIVHNILEKFGERGEAAVREGTRRYGRDRAIALREKHMKMNVKINMKSLFSVGADLPSDPRFKRELQELNSQERVSHTLCCPMADIWKSYGFMDIGRIYCEEFHFACYNEYAYGYTQVNLAKTQTQVGDEYCAFNIVLRPENLPKELKPVCFEEYDPNYVKKEIDLPQAYGKTGFGTLWIKLYYHLLCTASEYLGEEGINAVIKGLEEAAVDSANRLKKSAEEQSLTVDRNFINLNYPLEFNPDDEPMWETYNKCNAKELLEKHFYPIFYREAGI